MKAIFQQSSFAAKSTIKEIDSFEKIPLIELDVFSSSPKNNDNLGLPKEMKPSKRQISIGSVQNLQITSTKSHKSGPQRMVSVNIFKQSIQKEKESVHESVKKKKIANSPIRRTDTPNVVINLLERSKRDCISQLKDKSKGIMYINELWGGKYERKTIKAAQLDKELFEFENQHLQQALKRETIGGFNPLLENKKNKKKKLVILTPKEPVLHTEPDFSSSQGPKYQGNNGTTEPDIQSIKADNKEPFYSTRLGSRLPYLTTLQSERQSQLKISPNQKDLTSIATNEGNSSPNSNSEFKDIKDNVRMSPQISILEKVDILNHSPLNNEVSEKKLKDSNIRNLSETKRFPVINIGHNRLNSSNIDSVEIGNLTVKGVTEKNQSQRNSKLYKLINKCDTELVNKQEIVESFKSMREVFNSPRYNSQKRIEEMNRTIIVENCKSVIQQRIRREKEREKTRIQMQMPTHSVET